MLRTSRQRIYNRNGFTLMEVMVVVAIIAGAIALVLPRIANPNNQIRATLRELVNLNRELHTRAKLQGKTYRLVFQMKSDEPGKENQGVGYYVESSNGQVLLMKEEEEKEFLEKRIRNAKDPKQLEDYNGFSPDTSILKKPKTFPPGLELVGVELKRAKNTITQGRAAIHFFPQGLAEEAIVHFKTKDQEWSLIVDPMLGKAAMVGRKVTLKDIGSR